MIRMREVLGAVACALLVSTQYAGAAAIALDDGRKGMTCQFYMASARLEWRESGGDWVDVSGADHGDQAYASAAVRRIPGEQGVTWDVTRLASEWIGGRVPMGAVYLRARSGGLGGIVNFRSREHSEADQPLLLLEWSDGTRSRLAARADTYFACPTRRSLGAEKTIKVGGGHSAVVVFEVPTHTVRQLRSATLTLVSDKQYGGGADIDVFQVVLPQSRPAVVTAGLAAQFTNDIGIDKHADVLFAERFETSDWERRWPDLISRSAQAVAKDPERKFEPLDGQALRVTIEAGKRQALNTHLRLARPGIGEPDEAYFRYYLRLADNWDPVADGGKLPGFAGTYGEAGWGLRKSDGQNGWSTRGAFLRQTADDVAAASPLRGIGSYVYHPDLRGQASVFWGWNLGPTGLLRKNRWYSIEQHVRLNTPGKSDGVLRAWIDGQLAFAREGIRFRDVDRLKIESVWMNVYHGGTKDAVSDLSLYIDHLVIARRYIGPAAMHK